MLAEHLGQEIDVEPKRAAFENAVVAALRRHGPTRQRDLWYRAAGCRVGREVFQQVIDSLVERRVIQRETTNRVNSFLLRMTPNKRRRERAQTQERISQ